jgi:hypothetical protein
MQVVTRIFLSKYGFTEVVNKAEGFRIPSSMAAASQPMTPCYRLGPLGYLTIDDAGIGGNFAIQDLILGLEWVQSHIVAFGGDPVSFGLPYPGLEADANYISTEKGCLGW